MTKGRENRNDIISHQRYCPRNIDDQNSPAIAATLQSQVQQQQPQSDADDITYIDNHRITIRRMNVRLSSSAQRMFTGFTGFTTSTITNRTASAHRHIHTTTSIMAATRRSTRISAQTELLPPAPASAPAPASPNSRKRKPAPGPPATPPRKRATFPPPMTPTPSAVGVLSEPVQALKPLHSRINRLADPNTTNATLLSPETSRLIASRDVETVSPSKAASVKTTTENLLDTANKHLISVDERMRPLVEKNFCRAFSPEGLAETIDPFESLCSGIISQQVSGAAAKSIKAKFVGLFHDENTPASKRFPHPSEIAPCTVEHLRTAGLSQRKAEYIKGLAEKFATGELTAQLLHDLPYDELVTKLLAVRGLGRWSVEMFACFGLKRMDVFSLGDLGIQRGMAAFVGRDIAKLKAKGGKWKYMSEADMIELSDKFAPYRSLFMWYMWRVEETDVSTME